MSKAIDHEYTDEVVCPNCGYEFSDSWEFGDGGEDIGELYCDGCNKEFEARRVITIHYVTKILKP